MKQQTKKRLTGINNTYSGANSQYQYTYDNNDNIQTVTKNGVQTKYYYDSLNELIRVDDGDQNKTFTYTYDSKGNILSKSEYAFTNSETLPQAVSTINYAYGDLNWGDKLTSYNGNAITYDEIGNPLSYNGWAFTWQSGRQLKTMSKDGTSVSYKYDDNGIRKSKTVNGVTTNYTTIDGRITSQSDGTNMLYFRYDKNKELFGAQINGAEYIYVKNLQGDIVSILDTNGTSVVDYTYDAWGKVVSITGSMADTIGQLNPMRYRGYYYDNESGYYYLQLRYYDSNLCRFINADITSAFQLLKGEKLDANFFIYCGNNPVNRFDFTGTFWKEIITFIVHKANELLLHAGLNTAAISGAMLMMEKDQSGIYHATFDCWQQYFGYNNFYDFLFNLGTSMATAKFPFTYNGMQYILWAWKGDYVSLGAGAELGIYYGGEPHWLVNKSLAMQMHMVVYYKGQLIIDYAPSEKKWWITGFNPAVPNVQAKDLMVTFYVTFSNMEMFNAFRIEDSIRGWGWWCFDDWAMLVF